MEPNFIFYIDQYLYGRFVSRSEPFYERSECEECLEHLRYNSFSDIEYRVNVSMSLEDFEHLMLSSQRLHIRYIDTPLAEDVCVCNDNGFEHIDKDTSATSTSSVRDERHTDEHHSDEHHSGENHSEDNTYVDTRIKAFKYNKGYVIYNNKKNRSYIIDKGISSCFKIMPRGKLLYIKKATLNRIEVSSDEYFIVKKITQKVENLCSSDSMEYEMVDI